MTKALTNRVLVVVFDALRPEFVTPELMPALSAFSAGGVIYSNSHSTFFTETRVNQSAVMDSIMAATPVPCAAEMANTGWSPSSANSAPTSAEFMLSVLLTARYSGLLLLRRCCARVRSAGVRPNRAANVEMMAA